MPGFPFLKLRIALLIIWSTEGMTKQKKCETVGPPIINHA
jgi:hypothetical protein